METLLQDMRFGIRMLTRSAAFTVLAAATLALGIGANSAIFSVLNAVLLRPLPYENSSQLVIITDNFDQLGIRESGVSVPEFLDIREQAQSFEACSLIAPISANLTGVDQPVRIQARAVSANFFTMLGVEPFLGRIFLPEDDQPGITEIAVISYELWQRRFGGDLEVIGKRLKLDNDNFTVVGVLPRGFQHPDVTPSFDVEVWYPAGFQAVPFPPPARGDRRYTLMARLKHAITLSQARLEMNAIANRLQKEYPDQYQQDTGWNISVATLHEKLTGNIRPVLLILVGAVGFVLLIACANVANLLLARATVRKREVAIRSALGASRMRLLRQFLTESVLLAALGGSLGLLLAFLGVKILIALSPPNIPRLAETTLDGKVFAFALLATLVSGIVSGLVPAFYASRADLGETLKEGGRTGGAGARGNRIRSLLVVSEYAMALVLLICAGLLIRSFWRMQDVKPGFNPDNVSTIALALTWPNQPETGKYFRVPQRVMFYDQVIERVRLLPGVQSVGLITFLPMSGEKADRLFTIEGRETRGQEDVAHAEARTISPSYFSTMGIPLQNGREFTEQDDSTAPGVVVINESLARHFWPDQDPIGKRIKVAGPPPNQPWASIIGVVADVKSNGLDAVTPDEMYFSYKQRPPLAMNLVVRTTASPSQFTRAVQDEVRAVDNDQPVFNTKTMGEIISNRTGQKRFSMFLLGIFAVIALVLAAVGIYGVISYTVTQRTQEIGIRMALGASSKNILKLVVSQGVVIGLVGVAIGLAIAFVLTRVMSSLLFGVSATDLPTFAFVPLMLASVAGLASYIPGRKATKVDPMIALRHQ